MKQLLIFVACLVGLSGTRLLGQDLVWVKQTGGAGQDGPWAQAIDGLGNTYTTGYFTDICDFDPGQSTLSLSPINGQTYIRKVDRFGNLVWVTQSGSANGVPMAISLDATGNVYITGYFSTSGDFDPGTGVSILSPIGGIDIYILKLDALGNFIWAKQIAGNSPENARSIASDSNGDLYIGGYIYGTCDMDPSAGISNLVSVGSADGFLAKYGSSGNLIWAKSFGGSFIEQVVALNLDASGNIYASGYFQGTCDVDPGVAVQNYSAVGGNDIFVSKFDPNGNLIWARQLGGTLDEQVNDLELDTFGKVVLAGSFQGTVDFDPGVGVSNLVSSGSADAFIAQLDAAGNLLMARGFGGPSGIESANALTTDASGDIFAIGEFAGNGVDLDPGVGQSIFNSFGGSDVFAIRLTNSGNFVSAWQFGGTGNEIGSGIDASLGNLNLAGGFQGVCDFDPGINVTNMISSGMRDIFQLKLRLCQSSNFQISESVCESYVSPSGQIWTTSGTYQDTIPNVGGCDSVITINLTINPSAASTLTAASCTASYLSPSGNYVWTVSGTYLDTLSTINGCDSVITVNLSVNSVNATASANGNVLSATVSGATYQWLDCNGMTIIAGETGQSFSPIVSGSYAVAVTENGCTDTSACFSVTIIGIDPDIQSTTIAVYPNPSEGIFHVLGTDLQSVLVFNALGQTVFAEKPNQGVIDLSFLPKGMYWLRAQSGEGLSLPTTICIE